MRSLVCSIIIVGGKKELIEHILNSQGFPLKLMNFTKITKTCERV